MVSRTISFNTSTQHFLARLFLLVLVLVLFLGLSRSNLLPATGNQWLTDIAWSVFSLIAGLECYRVSGKKSGNIKRAWIFLAIAHASWFIGILIWSYLELIAKKQTPFPALSDLGFMLMAPFYLAAFYYFREPNTYQVRSVQVSKMLVIATGLVVLHIYLLMPRILGNTAGWLYLAAAMTYPVLYMSILLYGMSSFVHISNNVSVKVYSLVLLSFFIHALTDSLYAYSLLGHEYQVGHYLDVFWLLAFSIVMLAAGQEGQNIRIRMNVKRLARMRRFDSLVIPVLIGAIVIVALINSGEVDSEKLNFYLYADSVFMVTILLYQVTLSRLEHRLIKNLSNSELLREKSYSEYMKMAMVSSEKLEEQIRKRKKADADLEKHHALLATIKQVQDEYINNEDEHDFFDKLLETILTVTGSEYGFIGEVLYKDDKPYLKTYAITNIAWNEETRKFYQDNAPQGMEFYNLDSLFGYTLRTREMVISNHPANDERRGGLPEGHPALKAYLGMPLLANNKMVGMIGLANHQGGYSEEDVEHWKPLFSTCGNLVMANRVENERRLAEENLVEAKNEAEQASRAKSMFLSRMSHELRTPLNAILGFSQLIEIDDSLDQDKKESVGEIHKAGKHLLRLIDDLLDVGRIETDRLKYHIGRLDMNLVLQESIGYISDMAETKNITIEYAECPSLYVNGDETRLKQVFTNILSNAIKYNYENGDVHISLDKDDKNGVVTIKDSGMGIAEDKLKYLFDPFDRLGADQHSIDGLGIGLYITKQIIDKHHGEISVSSQPGKGTEFVIRIPLYWP